MSTETNETTKFINAKNEEQLLKTRNAELEKIMKLRIILKDVRQLKAPAEEVQVRRALKLISIADYVRLADTNDDFILDLRESYQSVNLSYTERKVVRELLTTSLRNTLRPIVEFGGKMRVELPDLFVSEELTSAASSSNTSPILLDNVELDPTEPNQSTSVRLTRQQQLIIDLEAQRRQKIEKLSILKNRKCEYLKRIAELKMGPYLANELEQLSAQARMSQIKTNLLRGYFINELVSRTEHSLKAHKEVEGYIDDAIAKADSDAD